MLYACDFIDHHRQLENIERVTGFCSHCEQFDLGSSKRSTSQVSPGSGGHGEINGRDSGADEVMSE